MTFTLFSITLCAVWTLAGWRINQRAKGKLCQKPNN